jgi:hypothetical protein
MHKINAEIDGKISNRLGVDGDILGDFWAKETRYIEEGYKTIPFPFKELDPDKIPTFSMRADWNLHQLLSYMQTWSAVKKYHAEIGLDPVSLIENQLERIWGDAEKAREVVWEIDLRIGII